MSKALVQLGRFGDVLNVLPLLSEVHRQGRPAALCVAKEFASVLDGVSYVSPIVWDGQVHEVPRAIQWLAERGITGVISQVTIQGPPPRRTDSYMRDSWQKVGMDHRWDQLALTFDRRDKAREKALVEKFDMSGIPVLVNVSSFSSPFPRPDFLGQLRVRFPDFNFIDISTLRAERLYDQLGLFDRAAGLITVDTSALHLAKASTVPVVAFTNPDPWLASLPSANHILTRRYNDIDANELGTALQRMRPAPAKLVRVYSAHTPGGEDGVRIAAARASWEREYAKGGWEDAPVHDEELRRNGTVLGDRAVPFVKDLLRLGMRRCTSPDDIVVIVNSDVGVTPGATEVLRKVVRAHGAAFCYRFNFDKPQISDWVDAVSGYWDGGLDLFAFTKRWLDANLGTLPDFLLGRPHWDLVYRDHIRQTGGGDATGCVWHQRHKAFWTSGGNPGNDYNTRLAQQFFRANDTTRTMNNRRR